MLFKRLVYRMVVVLFAVSAIGVLPCTAAEKQDDDVDSSSTDAETVDGDDTQQVIVSATRIATPADQVGSSVTLIEGSRIETMQHRMIDDVLRLAPGVDVRRSGGRGTLTEVRIRGAESDHTLLLLDGVRIHDNSAPGGGAVFTNLTTTLLDRVEVLRGPQSGVYGAEAIGGVVSMSTRKGRGPATFMLSAEAGSYNTTIERMTASGGDDRFNYALGLTRIDSGGFNTRVIDTSGERDPYRQTSFSGRFGYELSDQLGVDFVAHVINASVEFDEGFGTAHNTTGTNSDQYIFKVEPHVLLMDGRWESKLAFSMNKLTRDNFGAFPSNYEYTELGLKWKNSFILNEQHTLMFGVDYRNERGTFNDVVTAETNNIGIYLQDQFVFGRLSGVVSLRLDDHDDFGTEITYRAAAAYRLNDMGTILRASVGSGFKAPSLEDLFDTTSFVNNPNLDAETSIGFDAGIEQSFLDHRATVGVTYFYNKIKNMIFYDNATFIVQNIGDARTNGIEFFTQYRPMDNITARFNYTYLDTRVTEQQGTFGPQSGARLLRRPLHKFNFDLVWDVIPEKVNTTLSVSYVGQRDDTGPTGKAAAYTVVNLTGQYHVTKNVTLFGRVNNLFDENYQDVEGFYTPRASAYGGVKIVF